MKKHWDFLLNLIFGVSFLAIIGVSMFVGERDVFIDTLRIAIGYPYIFMLSGVGIARFFQYKNQSIWEHLLLSSVFSMLLTYPAMVLTVMWERSDIYQFHLDTSGLILFLLSTISLVLAYYFKKKNVAPEMPTISFKRGAIIMLLFALGLTFRIHGVEGPTIQQDEYELSYRAYDLIDGIAAGRKAFFVSAIDHSPLGFAMLHFGENTISPFGLHTLSTPEVRLTTLTLGMFVLFASAVIMAHAGASFFTLALMLLFLSIDASAIFASHLTIPQDLSYFSFFSLAFVYGALRYMKKPTVQNALLMGILFGVALLNKFSAIVFIPVIVLVLLMQRKKLWHREYVFSIGSALLVFSPVILYNALAFIYHNSMDVPFSRIARLFGISVQSVMPPKNIYGSSLTNIGTNFVELIALFIDQHSFPLFVAFVGALVYATYKWRHRSLYFVTVASIFSSLFLFSLNGFRVYYISFLAPFLIFILAFFFAYLFRKARMVASVIIIALTLSTMSYSLHSARAWFDDPQLYSEVGRSGAGGTAFKISDVIFNVRSLAQQNFMRDQGWDNLKHFFAQHITADDLVVFDKELPDLQTRWYLQSLDPIKKYYVPDYRDRYNIIYADDFAEGDKRTFFVTYHGKQPVLDTPLEHYVTISRQNGAPAFDVYLLQQ